MSTEYPASETFSNLHHPERQSEEIGRLPEKTTCYPGAPVFANLIKMKHLNKTELDLNAVDLESGRLVFSLNKNRSSFSKMRQALKQRFESKGKVLLPGHGTCSRGRFLSLDSADIFRCRSRNLNRRSSWYGGNIRNTSFRKCPNTHPSVFGLKPSCTQSRRCSRVSVQTLDSDDFPVQCGIKLDVEVDVHRTASGERVDTDVGTIRHVKPGERDFNIPVTINVNPLKVQSNVSGSCSSHKIVSGSWSSHKIVPDIPEICVEKTEVCEFDGKFCGWWLRIIDNMTRPCPGISEYLGPVLIALSMFTGFVIALTVVICITWVICEFGLWWM